MKALKRFVHRKEGGGRRGEEGGGKKEGGRRRGEEGGLPMN